MVLPNKFPLKGMGFADNAYKDGLKIGLRQIHLLRKKVLLYIFLAVNANPTPLDHVIGVYLVRII